MIEKKSQLDLSNYTLGKTSDLLELSNVDEVSDVSYELCHQAQRTLDIITRDLDRKIYDHEDFSSALFKLAKAGRHSYIRILVHDNTDAVRQGHEVLRLARKLSSYIHVKLISTEHKSFNSSYIIADKKGVILRELADRYDAYAYFNNPRLANQLQIEFDNIWAHAESDPNFRELRI